MCKYAVETKNKQMVQNIFGDDLLRRKKTNDSKQLGTQYKLQQEEKPKASKWKMASRTNKNKGKKSKIKCENYIWFVWCYNITQDLNDNGTICYITRIANEMDANKR